MNKQEPLFADGCDSGAARNANGTEEQPEAATATCWCSMGAIMRLEPSSLLAREQAYADLEIVAKKSTGNEFANIAGFNDSHTHAEVMTMFATAIATARARGD